MYSRIHGGNQRQQGSALVLVLIVLTGMLLGAMGMFKSSDVSLAVASNSAFKQGATYAANLAIDEAGAAVKLLANKDVASANYYPLIQATTARGLPVISWDEVPERREGVYLVQYVTERLCVGPMPLEDVAMQCQGTIGLSAGSAKVGAPSFLFSEAVYFRTTVRITGPKNTESYVQAVFSL